MLTNADAAAIAEINESTWVEKGVRDRAKGMIYKWTLPTARIMKTFREISDRHRPEDAVGAEVLSIQLQPKTA